MALVIGDAWQTSVLFAEAETEYRAWIEWTVLGIEALAVIIIIVAFAVATVQFLFGRPRENRFRAYRHRVGHALILALEILIAADIVNTVVLDPTIESIAGLGLLVVVRTFLSWTLVVDIENRWPWQPKPQK